MVGVDDTSLQPVHARKQYEDHEIVWGARHGDILSEVGDGRVILDIRRFHDVVPTEPIEGFPFPQKPHPWPLSAGGEGKREEREQRGVRFPSEHVERIPAVDVRLARDGLAQLVVVLVDGRDDLRRAASRRPTTKMLVRSISRRAPSSPRLSMARVVRARHAAMA